MTWAGESSALSSGLMQYTSDGSPGQLLGSPGDLVTWDAGMPVFVPQASITGVAPTSLNQIGDVNTLGAVSGQVLEWNGSEWTPATDDGGLNGPGSSTDNAVARWNGTGGNLVQDSPVIVDDSGTITMPGGQIVNGRITASTSVTMVQTDWVLISTAVVARTIFLPISPDDWQLHNIKDGAGNANSEKITLDGNGNTIDGCAEVTINGRYVCLTVVYNGTEWNII